MKNQLRGFSKVFSFTFKEHVKSKGYKNSTILIALLCLLLPAAVMTGLEMTSGDEPQAEQAQVQQQEAPLDLSQVKNIYLVDMSEDKKADMTGLPVLLEQAGIEVQIKDYGSDFDSAAGDCDGSGDTLMIVTQQKGSEYTMNIVLPDGSSLAEETAQGFDSLLMAYADSLSVASGGQPQYYGDADQDDADPMESFKQIVIIIFTFLNLMVLYFFVLAYGQGVANSVVTEKSSKLMESMLVAVKPAAIILGKLLAITLTGIIQLFSWIFGLVISFFIGSKIVLSINPDTDMMIIQGFKMLGNMAEGILSPANCIMALLMIMTGMLLYCALAGAGGAMASKAEDLSSANAILSLVLVASFLVSIYAGGVMEGDMTDSILDWIPFTSVMITPAKVLMGVIPLWKTLSCFAITVVTAVLVTLIAGKIYKSLVLYKGEPLKLNKLIKMMRG